jgi:deoxyribonuclease IV
MVDRDRVTTQKRSILRSYYESEGGPLTMVKVGVHVSIAGAISKAVGRATAAGCDTFQIFSRNPRGWAFRDLDPAEVVLFRNELDASGLSPAVDHMPYLPNLATMNQDFAEKSGATLAAELSRCSTLGIPYLVTHLGHYGEEGIEAGRNRVSGMINRALDEVDNSVLLLLENTAGEKNGVGSRFEDIAAVMEGIENPSRIGFCFDTCHAFGAGYDLRSESGLEDTLNRFDEILGLKGIRVVHLNDSKGNLGSGLDRHEHIGLGYIGEEGFMQILSHEVFENLPLICETPVDERRDDTGNIRKVREMAS